MPLHVECGFAGGGAFDGMHMPLERGNPAWSETLESGGVTAQGANTYNVFTVTADEDGWLAIGVTPNAGQDPRRRLKAGVPRSFAAMPGDRVAWEAIP